MPESRKQLSAQEIAGASVNSTEAASASSIVTTSSSSIVVQKRSSSIAAQKVDNSIAAQKVASSIAAADSIVATNSIAAHKADTK